jgi:hypothetical protein
MKPAASIPKIVVAGLENFEEEFLLELGGLVLPNPPGEKFLLL